MSEKIQTSQQDGELEPENAQIPENDVQEVVDQAEADEEIEPTIEEQLIEARKQAAEFLDGWQRARAEFANARKRLERDKTEAYRNATLEFAKKLLPAMDDFERALESVPEHVAEDSWYDGILLIQRKIDNIFDDFKVVRIEAVGQEFDPNFHEALSLVDADGIESGVIVEELQTGYRLGDKVIRPSLVNVAA